MGPRERADVLLPPFEMAIREGGARSVMHAYTDIDGVPAAADEDLLTGLLRDTWGFEGTVVADYFGIAFPQDAARGGRRLGRCRRRRAGGGRRRRTAHRQNVRAPLAEAVAAGRVPERVIDRALRRVLAEGDAPGLLDPDWDPVPAALDGADLDNPGGPARQDRPGRARQPRAGPHYRWPRKRSC